MPSRASAPPTWTSTICGGLALKRTAKSLAPKPVMMVPGAASTSLSYPGTPQSGPTLVLPTKSKFITPAARSFCHRKARQQVLVSLEDPSTMMGTTPVNGPEGGTGTASSAAAPASAGGAGWGAAGRGGGAAAGAAAGGWAAPPRGGAGARGPQPPPPPAPGGRAPPREEEA